jgi:hypothetical protein
MLVIQNLDSSYIGSAMNRPCFELTHDESTREQGSSPLKIKDDFIFCLFSKNTNKKHRIL